MRVCVCVCVCVLGCLGYLGNGITTWELTPHAEATFVPQRRVGSSCVFHFPSPTLVSLLLYICFSEAEFPLPCPTLRRQSSHAVTRSPCSRLSALFGLFFHLCFEATDLSFKRGGRQILKVSVCDKADLGGIILTLFITQQATSGSASIHPTDT